MAVLAQTTLTVLGGTHNLLCVIRRRVSLSEMTYNSRNCSSTVVRTSHRNHSILNTILFENKSSDEYSETDQDRHTI